tara:strand:+ start:3454 stop:4539 length:1086 start_codon:yes stop_codon:yes gene_type:complete
MKANLSEKEIEDVFEVFHEQLIETGLELISRQHILENRLRIDLLFKDKKGKNVAIELKRNAITREDVGQAIQYAGLIKNSRVILAAPIIATSIKNAFEHYGIEYLEFDLKEVIKLNDQIKINSRDQNLTLAKKIHLPQNIIKEPLSKNKKKDGNIAFKITYTDSNWSGVCSPNVAAYNFIERQWCGIQSSFEINCQHESFSNPSVLNKTNFPCYDCIAQKELMFYPGHFHGENNDNEPIPCLQAKVGKIAVFTSREPGEPENERFIFAIGLMNYFEPITNGEAHYENFHCDKKSAIIFRNTRPKYWKYYSNANNPERVAWNTGLFRYLDDNTVRSLLMDIIETNRYPGKYKKKAEYLLSHL